MATLRDKGINVTEADRTYTRMTIADIPRCQVYHLRLKVTREDQGEAFNASPYRPTPKRGTHINPPDEKENPFAILFDDKEPIIEAPDEWD